MALDKKQMDAIVNRFLGWKLPPTFGPDAGIKFTPSNGMSREEAYAKPGWWPVGTNLLTADEARAMLEYVLEAAPGFKLLKDTTHGERSWPEDYDHENGRYCNTCCNCLREFVGHKRRVICKPCAHPAGASAPA